MKTGSVSRLFALIEQRGAERYGMEPVTQLQHALQCAQQAYLAGESAQLITAALLHDVGHLFEPEDLDGAPEADLKHEERAAAGLRQFFGPAVTEPVRLHVAAKRYLCQARPEYWDGLSEASKASLIVQGSVFTAKQAADFIEQPYAHDAVELRLWDDLAKNPDAITPPLAFFEPIVHSVLKTAKAADRK